MLNALVAVSLGSVEDVAAQDVCLGQHQRAQDREISRIMREQRYPHPALI
jgi:hypothetical protein